MKKLNLSKIKHSILFGARKVSFVSIKDLQEVAIKRKERDIALAEDWFHVESEGRQSLLLNIECLTNGSRKTKKGYRPNGRRPFPILYK